MTEENRSVEVFRSLYRQRVERAKKEALLTDAQAKLNRAGEHLEALVAEIQTFREADSHSIEAESDPNSGAYFMRVFPYRPPPKVGAIVGDVLCNLRPTLDYLVYALAYLDSGEPQEQTQFPICDSSDLFDKQRWRLKALSAEHVAAIEALQPYDGRDDLGWLRHLRDLSNPDKHKHLSIVTNEIGGGFEVLDQPERRLDTERTKDGGVRVNIRDFADMKEIARRVNERGKPKTERDGIVFSIPSGHPLDGSDVYVQIGLRFQIAFDNGFPVAETLKFLHGQVRRVLEAFEPDFQAV